MVFHSSKHDVGIVLAVRRCPDGLRPARHDRVFVSTRAAMRSLQPAVARLGARSEQCQWSMRCTATSSVITGDQVAFVSLTKA